MNCKRCNGLVVLERMPYTSDPWQRRCLNCGDVESNLILRNRKRQAKEASEAQEHIEQSSQTYSPVPEYQDVPIVRT